MLTVDASEEFSLMWAGSAAFSNSFPTPVWARGGEQATVSLEAMSRAACRWDASAPTLLRLRSGRLPVST
jgi:hypothetical protein